MRTLGILCLVLFACGGGASNSIDADRLAFDARPAPDAGSPGTLFDPDLIRDPATAACTFTNERPLTGNGFALTVWDVSYNSWESIDGVLVPIVIRGYAARPQAQNNNVPGVVKSHGLGGFAVESDAANLALLLNTFVLAYTGPGGGDVPANTSEGRPAGYDSSYRLFDTLIDVRGSWFWGHTIAALRGLTCLETRAEVDPTRLGMTGGSAGGVATLLGAAVDDRIVAAVPQSGTLAWDVATEAANAWQHSLLTNASLDTQSQEWQILMNEMIAADVLLPDTSARVFMVNGTTDEFFPLTAHMASYDALPVDKRLSFSANFDHGCYSTSGVEPVANIEARAGLRYGGAQRAWFLHAFGTDARYATIPVQPVMQLTAAGAATVVAAVVDTGGSELEVERVWVWWSNDDSLIYGSVELDPQGGNAWGIVAGFPLQANTVAYDDVQYKTTDLAFPERFALSSAPRIPPGFVPRIRSAGTCLP